MTDAEKRNGLEAKLFRFLEGRRLGWWLALIALILASPSLFIGFYLDDYIARYIYSDLPGAERLYNLWTGGYGLSTGKPEDNLWQVEQGWAPWWVEPTLMIRLFRPLGLFFHNVDAWLFPDVPFLQHLHSFLWTAGLILVATRMYRVAHGALLGGMAALLFALDHTHGFTVGYICNRHALISGIFSILCLTEHMRWRGHGRKASAFLSPLCLAIAYFASEATVSVVAYIVTYAAFAEKGPLVKRALSALPCVLVTVVWRAAYNAAGYGAHGSGMYLDPVREPVLFVLTFFERGPVLLLGQFFAPPAEFYVLFGPVVAKWILGLAILFSICLIVALVPLLMRDRMARFWASGALLAMVPAASAYPHNRQLLIVSFGAMALIAQLWHRFAVDLKGQTTPRKEVFAGGLGALLLFSHLVASPLAMPVAACSVAFSAPLHNGITTVGDEIAGKDAIFMTAPDYFAVKLTQLSKRAEQRPLPRRWRVLSFGPEPVTVRRTDERTLIAHYVGGALQSHLLELYRDKRSAMEPGYRVELEGLSIEVLEVTPDGRPERVRFRFDTSLDSDQFIYYVWKDNGYARWHPPEVGQEVALPPAEADWGLD